MKRLFIAIIILVCGCVNRHEKTIMEKGECIGGQCEYKYFVNPNWYTFYDSCGKYQIGDTLNIK